MRSKGLVTALLIAVLLHALYVGYTYNLSKGAQTELLLENQVLTRLLEQLKSDLTQTNLRLDEMEKALLRDTQLSEALQQQIVQNGHGDPDLYIRETLMQQNNAIQSLPVLGGTFYINKCILLSDNLAWIAFEDGHVAGFALWQFSYIAPSDSVDVVVLFEKLE